MNLTLYPDPILLTRCRELTDEEISIGKYDGIEFKTIFRDMRDLMREKKGCGLAAPQVGLPIRLFIAELDDSILSVINPVLSECKGRAAKEEGCLSIPGVYGYVLRWESLVLSGLDCELRKFKIKLKGMSARICQHESDHLDGKLFIDKMAMVDVEKYAKKLKSMREEFERGDA